MYCFKFNDKLQNSSLVYKPATVICIRQTDMNPKDLCRKLDDTLAAEKILSTEDRLAELW